jgi:hypothetical protein
LHIDVALFSEANFKAHERFFIPNFHFYRTDRFPERKGGTTTPVSHVDLPVLASREDTGVCILVGNIEVLLAAVY